MAEPTKLRLARVLREHGLEAMAAEAERGRYDDYQSESATPGLDLVNHLQAAGQHALARRAIEGEWDATPEEADAWAVTPDGLETHAWARSPEGKAELARILSKAGASSMDELLQKMHRTGAGAASSGIEAQAAAAQAAIDAAEEKRRRRAEKRGRSAAADVRIDATTLAEQAHSILLDFWHADPARCAGWLVAVAMPLCAVVRDGEQMKAAEKRAQAEASLLELMRSFRLDEPPPPVPGEEDRVRMLSDLQREMRRVCERMYSRGWIPTEEPVDVRSFGKVCAELGAQLRADGNEEGAEAFEGVAETALGDDILGPVILQGELNRARGAHMVAAH